MKKFAFSLPEKSAKKDFIFNMYGSMLMSFVSVFLLVAVSQILGEDAAGIFSIAYSTAQMFYTIGAYEVRNIQVTDAKGEFEFADCLAFRMITTAVMVVVSECFVIFKGFDAVKSSVIMLLCVYMAFVSLSEVFQGNAHKNGYLYISGFSLGTSVLLASVAFIITLIVTKNLCSSGYLRLTFLLRRILINRYPNFALIKLKVYFCTLRRLLFRCLQTSIRLTARSMRLTNALPI